MTCYSLKSAHTLRGLEEQGVYERMSAACGSEGCCRAFMFRSVHLCFRGKQEQERKSFSQLDTSGMLRLGATKVPGLGLWSKVTISLMFKNI